MKYIMKDLGSIKTKFLSVLVIALVVIGCQQSVLPLRAEKVFQEVGGLIVIQNESVPWVSPWVSGTATPGYTGSSYITWAGASPSWPSPTEDFPYRFKFRITNPGRYFFVVRNYITVPYSSFFAQLDGAPQTSHHFSYTTVNAWNWNTWVDTGTSHHAAYYDLTAGVHTLAFKGRTANSGYKMDRIHLYKAGVNALSTSLPESPFTDDGGGGTPNYTLSVSKSGTGAGTVSGPGINCGTDCSQTASSGTVVVLTATPAAGSTFTGWSGACTGTGNCTVTLNANKAVTASFSSTAGTPNYTLSVSKSGTGAGTVSGPGINCGTDCSQTASSGTVVVLTATPAAGSTFTGWSGACTGTGNCTVTLNANKAVTASFSSTAGTPNYTLSVSKSGTGAGTVSGPGINCGTDCSQTASSGTVVVLTATPAAGSTFTGWSGACTGTGNCTVTLNANKAVTASFSSTGGGGAGGGTLTTVNDGSSLLTYVGAWTDDNNGATGRINEDEHYTTQPGAFVQFTFTGVEVRWIATKHSNRGQADVSIDGVYQATIDTYSPGTLYQQAVYVKTGLSSGSHTIKIVCKGTKNPSSTGTYVDVDAIKYVPSSAGQTTVNDDSPAVNYGGSWTDYDLDGRINGDEHHTQVEGSDARLTFSGTQITWIVTKASNRGRGDVYIDGILQATIDLYSATTQYQQNAYVKTGLSSGSHTIRIVCKGTKSASSTGTYIDVDAFRYQ